MDTVSIVIIVATALVIVLAIGIPMKIRLGKKSRLIKQGKIIKRKSAFFKQAHVFTTKIGGIETIAETIDTNTLNEEKISFKPNYEKSMVVFHNHAAMGSFGAALRLLLQDGETYSYRFQVEAWNEINNGISYSDMLGANLLLTAIERAFMQLDGNTTVKREKAIYKTKTKFF